MFGKKVLSLVGLLFMGSQLLSMTRADGECGITYTIIPAGTDTCVIQNSCANGYYIVSGSDNELTIGGESGTTKYIKVKEGSCKDAAPGDNSGCSGNAGKLAEITKNEGRKRTTVTKLCLDVNDENAVGFDEDGSYLVDTNSEFETSSKIIAKVGNNVIRSIAIDSTTSYLVTDKAELVNDSNGNTVIIKNGELDSTLMGVQKIYCVDDDMVVWDRKADFCNDDKKGECTYVNCVSGDCQEKHVNLVRSEEEVVNPAGECDIKTSPENCIENTYYLIATANETPMAPLITAANDASGPYSLVKCFKATEDADVTCSVQGAGSIPTGYLANAGRGDDGTAYYIQCISNVCTPVADVDTRLSSVNGAGKHMIVLSTPLLGVSGAETYNYVVVTKEGSNYLIETSGDGYYTTTGTLVQNSIAGDLYNCADQSGYTECEKITTSIPIGYLVNGGDSGTTPYIKCTVAGACQAYAPVTTCEGENDSNYGDLYDNQSGTISLCKVKNNGVELILDGASRVTGEFFASVATGKSLFEIVVKDGYNVVLNFADGNIVVDNDPIRYRYTLSGETKIHDRETAVNEIYAGEICETSTNGANAFEYILVNWTEGKEGLSDVAYYVKEDYSKPE